RVRVPSAAPYIFTTPRRGEPRKKAANGRFFRFRRPLRLPLSPCLPDFLLRRSARGNPAVIFLVYS
ncbi:hypothetical protein, partial [Pseudomonas aeruginosa]